MLVPFGQYFSRLKHFPQFLLYFLGGFAIPHVVLSLFFLVTLPALIVRVYLQTFLGTPLFSPGASPFPWIPWIAFQIGETLWTLSPLFLGGWLVVSRNKYQAGHYVQGSLWAFLAGLVLGLQGAIVFFLVSVSMTGSFSPS